MMIIPRLTVLSVPDAFVIPRIARTGVAMDRGIL